MATATDLLIRIRAEIGEATAALAHVKESVQQVGQALSSTGQLSASLVKIGATLSAVGASAGTAMGTVVAAAQQFESSFAGVRKTVDATEEELAQLAVGMKRLALEKPIDVNELNRIGEAAGQLGIATAHILDFTATMADLAVSTNLTSDQAATAFARIANIMQLPQTEFRRLGSALVELGNHLATTEAEITEMALRLAGAGKTVNLTTDQVFAFAAALSSVGLRAEAGGSALSRVMIDIANAVAQGGEDLQRFAQVAGLSAQAFAQLFRRDAASAILAFIEGLGRLKATGQDIFGVLSELGLKEIIVRDALLRTANAGDLVRQSLQLASRAFQENTALSEEAAKRYATFESQVTLAWNAIKNVAITLGMAFLPILTELLQNLQPILATAADFAEWFASLDEGVRKTVLIFTAAFAASGPILLTLAAFMAALPALTAPLTVGGAIVTGILAGTAAVIANWETLTTKGKALWAALKGAVVKTVQELVEGVKTWIVDRLTAVMAAVQRPIDAVKKAFHDLFQAVVGGSIVPDMVNGIQQQFERLTGEAMVRPTETAVEKVQGALGGVRDFWIRQLNDLVNSHVFSLSQITTQFSGAVADWMMGLDSFRQFGQQVMRSLLQAMVQFVIQWIALEALRAATTQGANSTIAGSTLATFTALGTGIKWLFLGLAKAVVGVIGVVVSGVSVILNSVSVVISFMLFTVGQMLIKIGAALQKLPLIVTNIIGAILIGLGMATIALATALPGIVAAITAGLSAGVASLAGAIPALAHGGVVTQPTLALIGEAGPEAVVPLSGRGAALAGAGETHIHVHVGAREVMHEVLRELPRTVRLRTGLAFG